MVVEKVVTCLIAAVVGAFFSWLFADWKNKHARDRAIAIGVQCLLREALLECHREYIAKGYIPMYAEENVVRMYNAYHNLGGNDIVTALVEQIRALPNEGDTQNEDM